MFSKVFLICIVLFTGFELAQADDRSYLTPLEKSNYSNLSGYSDILKYLKELDSKSEILKINTIGKSVEGRAISALYFSLDKSFASNRSIKPVVLIYCQQHGNEPSGKEAALILSRKLINEGEKILSKMDLILVPQVNPDGAEQGKRKNANQMDLNRNHVILSEPESQALHNLFLKWMPQVTLDVHEYNAIKKEWINNGYVKDAEEMLGGVTNLNIDSQIINFSRNIFIPEAGKQIQNDGFTFHRYIVGAPFENKRIRFSTTAINDGRQSMGIYNTLSFLIEGKRYGDLNTNIERRTKGQVAALLSFLKTVAKYSTEIIGIVSSARNKIAQEKQDDFTHLNMDYFPDSSKQKLKFPIFDLNTWQQTEIELENFEPNVKIIKSVKRPTAYIFSQNENRLIALLNKHQIEMFSLKNDLELKVESLTTLHVTPTTEEDKAAENVDVYKRIVNKKFIKGEVVIYLNQKAGNLIPLMLEPQSTWSICTERSGRKYRFSDYIEENMEYPIYRLMNAQKMEVESY